jgi:hypothetical protein
MHAQRLAAQLLGHLRFVFTILAGKLKPHIGVRSLSLGQVSCSRGLGRNNVFSFIGNILRFLIFQ